MPSHAVWSLWDMFGAGVNSITVYYRGHRGLAAEVLHFSASGKVREAFAHYAEWSREDAG